VTARPRASALAAVALVDDEGRPRRVGDVWAQRAAALFFLRHWG
jgi:hypothetical protein